MLIQSIALLVLCLSPEGKEDEALLRSLKEADVVFTARIGKVSPLGQTNSIPPSTFGEITFLEPRALRGTVQEGVKYSYSFREGTTKNMNLKAQGLVLVAVKGKSVTVIVPATEDTIAFTRKAIEGKEQ
jgi:hypothetical protein